MGENLLQELGIERSEDQDTSKATSTLAESSKKKFHKSFDVLFDSNDVGETD